MSEEVKCASGQRHDEGEVKRVMEIEKGEQVASSKRNIDSCYDRCYTGMHCGTYRHCTCNGQENQTIDDNEKRLCMHLCCA